MGELDEEMVYEAREGEVILLGAGITAEDFADWTGTNEYEVMTNISARVPRVFVR